MRHWILFAAFALATASFTADAQQTYRWVDDNGSTRISDRIPPDATDKRIEVLNARGMVVRVIEPKRELTPDEVAAQAADAAAAETAKQEAAEQARRDRMLLDMYTSVDDLIRSRDTRVSALEAQVRVSRAAVEAHKANLVAWEEQAAGHTAAGRAVPPGIAAKVDETRAQLDASQAFMDKRVEEQAAIRAQFEADIARFRALRGG